MAQNPHIRRTTSPAEDLAKLPAWTEDPLERLEHTLAAHTDTPRGGMALYATSTSHPEPGVPARTGVTWADLEALAVELRTHRHRLDG